MKGQLANATCVRNSLLDAISVGWRLDLRKHLECRRFYLRVGSQGCCVVRIGSTVISCVVAAEIEEPKASRPSEGMLTLNLSFVSPVVVVDGSTRPQEYVNEIRSLLRDSILQSGSIDLESLCIISGEKVWSLNVTLSVLNSEGNVLDCASIATIAALADFVLPAYAVEGQCVRVWNEYEKNPVPLVMNHYPIFTTFCLFNEGKTVIIDPSDAEERLAESKLYIAVNARQEICALKSVAKKPILADELHNCIALAEEHVREVTKVLQAKLETSKQIRKLSPPDAYTTKHSTFSEMFDVEFDVPWKKLIGDDFGEMEESVVAPAEQPVKMEYSSNCEKEDEYQNDQDDNHSEEEGEEEEEETVEYSEFSSKSKEKNGKNVSVE